MRMLCCMYRSFRKLLAVLLMLLLGFSPLQLALADTFISLDEQNSPCAMSTLHTDQNILGQSASAHDCDQCKPVDECQKSCSSAGHCSTASSLSALLLTFSFSPLLHLTQICIVADQNTLDHLSPSLFRPPRA